MTCKPRDIENTAKEVALQLIPENWIQTRPDLKFWSEVNVNQRYFTEKLLIHLMNNGWINPWGNDHPPLPQFAEGNNPKPGGSNDE